MQRASGVADLGDTPAALSDGASRRCDANVHDVRACSRASLLMDCDQQRPADQLGSLQQVRV